MINAQRTSNLQEQFGLSYQIPYALTADSLVGFEGKRVLEIGGSLPRGLVLDELKASQWISVEALDYWDELPPEAEPQSASEPDRARIVGRLEDAAPVDQLPEHAVLVGGIEALPRSLHTSFDAIFSIACFEHVQRFPDALEAAFLALKPGGVLFSLFAPIWSAHDGHHLPVLFDAMGQKLKFSSSPIPPWGHLTMTPPELHQYLLRHTDRATADRMIYFIFQSPHINRLFAEDYVRYVQASPFEVLRLEGVFPSHVPAGTQAVLERLYPRYRYFSNNGMLMLLRRPG